MTEKRGGEMWRCGGRGEGRGVKERCGGEGWRRGEMWRGNLGEKGGGRNRGEWWRRGV